MARTDRTFFVVFAGIVWVYLLVRAAIVPPVHDECASLLWYVRPGDWIPYLAHWDANNHYLNSAIGIGLTRVFGESLLALRAGSLLAFVVYSWAALSVGEQVRSAWVRWCLYAALLLCPFVLDFFALFRGYGIEMACWLLALDGLMRFTTSGATRHLLRTLLPLIVANAAIVALVPVWTIILVVTGYLLWAHRRNGADLTVRIGIWLLLGLLPLYGASLLALELKERGLLYHGSTAGFFDVTVRSLSNCMLNLPSAQGAATVLLAVGITCAFALFSAVRSRELLTPVVVVTAVLCGDALMRVVLAMVSGVNYPEDRAALHFVPMVLIVSGLAVDQATIHWPKAAWAATLMLLLPARTLWTANLDHTLAWREQSVPARFIATASELGKRQGRAVVVGGQHQLALAWPIWSGLQGREPMPLCGEGFPAGPDDLRVVDERFLQEASEGYEVVDSATGPGLWLLRKVPAIGLDTLAVLRAPDASSRAEFMDLVHVPDSFLKGTAVHLQLDVPLLVPSSTPDLRLVLEVNDTTGTKVFYDAMPPVALRSRWTGQAMRWCWGLPALPAVKRAVIYLYNPERRVVSHGKVRALVSAVRE
jgi:hypothetical protein